MRVERVEREVLEAFGLTENIIGVVPYGNGHINDTFALEQMTEEGRKRYIIQHMNKAVFREPAKLMENISGVTTWLRKKIIQAGGDPERETLNVRDTVDGKSSYEDKDGEFWRVFPFVEDAVCYEQVKCPDDFYQSALAFGNFQRLLADYPAHTLYETIPDFHNTPKRYRDFLKAVEEDREGRVCEVQKEIDFVKAREAYTRTLYDLQKNEEIPLRVTHNDTKLNNILIDNETGKGICVIDLDTVMPGLAANDFGDSIRFGASTAVEDERDLSKVSCDLKLFEVYTRGFMEGCAGALTEKEIECLTDGAIMMTLECGIRFLTDYIEGDHYFRIHRPGQNLDRARTQFTLVQDMENKKTRMNEIVRKIAKEAAGYENL